MERYTHFYFFSFLLQCLTFILLHFFSVDDVEGIELLRWEDQQMIRKYIEGGRNTHTQNDPATYVVMECGVEVSQTSRATCKYCNQKRMKGEVGYFV